MTRLTATRHEWTTTTAWTLWLDGKPVGSVWRLGAVYADRGAYGWRRRGQYEWDAAPTCEAACAALIAACGLDATPPERWP